jgi:hypothetical protein
MWRVLAVFGMQRHPLGESDLQPSSPRLRKGQGGLGGPKVEPMFDAIRHLRNSPHFGFVF